MNTPPIAPDRRRFLIWGGLTVFAASMAAYLGRRGTPRGVTEVTTAPAATTVTEPPVTITPDAPVEITHEGIRNLVDTEFTFDRVDEAPVTGTLIEVTPERRINGPDSEYRAFSLIFAVPVAFPKDGSICKISHPQLIPEEVFLSPVGRPAGGLTLLEAAFSLRV